MSGTSRQNSSSTSAVLLKNRSDTSAALMNSSGASAVLTKSSASQQQWQCLQPTVQCRPSWTAMLQFLLKKQQWQCHKSMLNKCLTSCQPSAIELSGMLTISECLLKRARRIHIWLFRTTGSGLENGPDPWAFPYPDPDPNFQRKLNLDPTKLPTYGSGKEFTSSKENVLGEFI